MSNNFLLFPYSRGEVSCRCDSTGSMFHKWYHKGLNYQLWTNILYNWSQRKSIKWKKTMHRNVHVTQCTCYIWTPSIIKLYPCPHIYKEKKSFTDRYVTQDHSQLQFQQVGKGPIHITNINTITELNQNQTCTSSHL